MFLRRVRSEGGYIRHYGPAAARNHLQWCVLSKVGNLHQHGIDRRTHELADHHEEKSQDGKLLLFGHTEASEQHAALPTGRWPTGGFKESLGPAERVSCRRCDLCVLNGRRITGSFAA